MQYLFFDIESATGAFGDICEFGYVITNEKFELIKKENILINPNCEFSKKVKNKILSYDVKTYQDQPDFPKVYEQIKKLLNDNDYVFGFADNNDAEYINAECLNYQLPFINFTFYDIQKVLLYHENLTDCPSLEACLEKYQISIIGKLHNAMDDAYNSMLLLKKLMEQIGLTLDQLLTILPEAKDETKGGIIKSLTVNKAQKEQEIKERFRKCENVADDKFVKNKIRLFAKSIELNEKATHPLKGKMVMIDKEWVNTHPIATLNLISDLASIGVSYDDYISKVDIYVKNNFNKTKIIKVPKKVNVMDFNELLKHLKITLSELEQRDFPSLDNLTDGNISHRGKVSGKKCLYIMMKEDEDKDHVYLGEYLKEFLKK